MIAQRYFLTERSWHYPIKRLREKRARAEHAALVLSEHFGLGPLPPVFRDSALLGWRFPVRPAREDFAELAPGVYAPRASGRFGDEVLLARMAMLERPELNEALIARAGLGNWRARDAGGRSYAPLCALLRRGLVLFVVPVSADSPAPPLAEGLCEVNRHDYLTYLDLESTP